MGQSYDELAREFNKQGRFVTELRAENEWLWTALQGLVDGVVPEVNEKGAGGYLLARLSDARAALGKG